MGKIVILDENTANKIAAGEVVERPASVVKEMIENSIDAGAESITIEIKKGGISYIRITDNGSGIDDDDVEIAFERHATSKIRKAEDLESISSLGFRGEALASIAAVSDVELTTRTKNNSVGKLVKVRGGIVKDVKMIGCPVGTTFVVRNLFYNTPARFKFLKKDTTETGYISNIITRVALANPNISFRFINNNATIIHTPGNNDLLSTIFSLYGKEIAKGVSEIEYKDNKIQISGYAGKPEIGRGNRNYQSIFINGRYIKSKLIASAIEEAYKTFLMKNKFPFIVLKIDINPILVDVNVHPTKMEVRFSEEQEIFRSVYHAIKSALLSKSLIREADLNNSKKPIFKLKEFENKNKEFDQQKIGDTYKKQLDIVSELDEKNTAIEKKPFIIEHTDKQQNVKTFNPTDEKNKSNQHIKENLIYHDYVQDITKLNNCNVNNNELMESAKKDEEAVNLDKINKQEIKKSNLIEETNKEVNNEIKVDKKNKDIDLFINSKIIGQAFSTYILLQHNNELVLIDQHAAHERAMFERLKEKFNKNEAVSQVLLSPVVIELTQQEIKLIEEYKEFIIKLGFELDNFGNNSIILRSVPIETDSVEMHFKEIIDFLLSKRNQEYSKIADEVLYQIACKSAIKANENLSEIEIKSLLETLAALENPYTCPHGRPVIISITKNEFEKKFKRIL